MTNRIRFDILLAIGLTAGAFLANNFLVHLAVVVAVFFITKARWDVCLAAQGKSKTSSTNAQLSVLVLIWVAGILVGGSLYLAYLAAGSAGGQAVYASVAIAMLGGLLTWEIGVCASERARTSWHLDNAPAKVHS